MDCVQDIIGVEGLFAKILAEVEIFFLQVCFDFFAQQLVIENIAEPDRIARDLVFIGRSDAATGCADFVFAFFLLAGDINFFMIGHDQVGVFADL